MSYKVLIPQYVPPEGIIRLKELGCELVTDRGGSEDEIVASIGDCQAVLARTAPFTRRVMEAGAELKIVARYGIGVDNIDYKAAEELGIWVSNTPLSNLNTVAEHTVGLMLASARNMPYAGRELRRGNFAVRNGIMGCDLEGKTVGLIGLGKIGSLVAHKCIEGFGMHVIAYDPYLTPDKAPRGVELCTDWERVFSTSDFISMHLPLNPSTRGIVGAKEFKLMKSTAYFINCARGDVVNEASLIDALLTGQIAGAALDVFESETPAPDNPLFTMDNVVLTPHTASFTREAFLRIGQHAARCIEAVLFDNAPPPWPVNHPARPR